MRKFIFFLALTTSLAACTQIAAQDLEANNKTTMESYSTIYWSDGDSGRLGKLKFRLANIDAPETGSMKQRGGAKCEHEREIGYEAKVFIVEFTKNKTIRIVKDYGEDRYGRLVVDIEADGNDVAKAGVQSGHLKSWPHINGKAQSPKPDWCASL